MDFLTSVTSIDALERINSFPLICATEEISLDAALGRVLGGDLLSGEDIPSFDRSLVDGFAVRARDTHGAKETTPLMLSLRGEVRVGEESRVSVEEGSSVYVSTGAMIPAGADSVVMQEYARRLSDAIEVTRTAYRAENIIFRGEDVTKGKLLFTKGRILSPFDLGVLAALGISSLSVFRIPTVAVISSGDEIVSVDRQPPPGKVRDINRYTTTGLLNREGVKSRFLGITGDTLKEIGKKLLLAKESDLILISGGSSKGERDYIVDAIQGLGGTIYFHGINIKPGKPTIFGELWGKPLFGLPGHPNSCTMVMIRFVVPLVSRMKGETGRREMGVQGILTSNVPSTYGVEEYVRVVADRSAPGLSVAPLFAKSSVISALSGASGYIVVPEGCEGYEKGEEVEVILFP